MEDEIVGVPEVQSEEFDVEAGLTALEELKAEENKWFLQTYGYSSGDPDLWLYRDRTTGMLRRYNRFAVEVGRLPSLLGREFFRTQVTTYSVGTFEDAVIFVHDVKKCLEKLGEFEKKLISKIVFQDYTHDEAARLMGCWRRTVGRRFPEAIDQLSGIFLEAGLLDRLPKKKFVAPKSCQEGETVENSLSDCEQDE